MRILFILFIVAGISLNGFAQEEERRKEEVPVGFNINKLYAGGGIVLNAGGWNNTFIIGANPEIGYSFGRYLDVGIALNFTSISQNDNFTNDKFRNLIYGAGPYIRIHPLDQLFIQAGAEFNQTRYKEIYSGGGSITYKVNSTSFPVGIGYGQRLVGESSFYTAILIDMGKDFNSPYIDLDGRKIPIFRTGFIFYFGRNRAR